jgi:hypothetical protein
MSIDNLTKQVGDPADGGRYLLATASNCYTIGLCNSGWLRRIG